MALKGLGLRLREWTDEDLQAMVGLFDDAQVARWTPLASPFDLVAARGHLDRARGNRSNRLQLAITEDGRTPKGEVLLIRNRDDWF